MSQESITNGEIIGQQPTRFFRSSQLDFGVALDENGQGQYRGKNSASAEQRAFSIASLHQKQIPELNQVSEFLWREWGGETTDGPKHPEASGSELITILDAGGVVISARDTREQLSGASQALFGRDRENRFCYILDLLAVSKEHHNFGLGRAINQTVLSVALQDHVLRVYLTFDPTRANLWGLYVGRLGAQVVDFVENKYGNELAGAQNSAEFPSDRVVGVWDLTNERTIQKIRGFNLGASVRAEGLYRERIDLSNTHEGVAQRAAVLGPCQKDRAVVDYLPGGVLVFGPRTQNYGLRNSRISFRG